MKRTLRVCVALPLVFFSTTAAGQEATQGTDTPRVTSSAARVEARIVAIEGEDLVIDLGRTDGLAAGSTLQLWRPIRLRHPVTRAWLTDRFLIGKIRLTQVRDVLSLGQIVGTPHRQPEVGDVVLGREVRATMTPDASPGRGSAGGSGGAEPSSDGAPDRALADYASDPDAAAVIDLFQSLAGASVVERIRRYEAFREEHPESRFSQSLGEEAMALRQLVELHQGGEVDSPSIERRAGTEPRRALSGMPLDFGIDIEGGAAGAILHTRHRGEVQYVSTPMTEAGPGYFRATLPAEHVKAPYIEMFVEAIGRQGAPIAVQGTADAPRRVPVDRIPEKEPPPEHRMRVSVLTDYADYNRLRGDDRVWQTEGNIGLRFSDVGVRALRSGFGVYRGVGGSVFELDELDLPPRSVGLTYGHLEGEFAFHPSWALIGRAVLGLGDHGMTGGAQAFLRIGSDLGTNLSIGGEVLGGVGLRGITELQLDPEGTFPVTLRSEVTNQPAGSGGQDVSLSGQPTQESIELSDVGIRAIAQVGYRIVRPLVISVRGSYQGRTIDHAGPGVGGAVSYTW